MERSENAYIKLYKKIREWEWYSEPYTFKIFIDCLIRANWKDTSWKGVELKRGQFISSLSNLAKDNGLTVQNVRTVIKRLKSTGELTNLRHGNFTIFTVKNYDYYQSANTPSNITLTDLQQTSNKPLTTDKEYKEIKNNKKEKRGGKAHPFTPPTLEEVKGYCTERNNKVDPKRFYDYYTASDWKDSKGNKVKSWKQKVISWERSDNGNAGKKPAANGNRFHNFSERDYDFNELEKKFAGN